LVQNCIPPVTHKIKSGTLLRKVYVNRSDFAPEYGYLTPQNGVTNSKYIARDKYITKKNALWQDLIQSYDSRKTLWGEMWHGG
jgi:hypothetical protein